MKNIILEHVKKYPLMEDPKEKGKKVRYKILTFQDIDNYLESRKSFVY